MKTENLIKQIHRAAVELGACAKFTGQESLLDIIELLYSPQGREFCISHEFPTIDVLRKFKRLGVDRYGIYIDAGTINVREREKVFLIGNTQARISCSQTQRYECYLMHGAFARIAAHDYACVHVEHDTQSIAQVELNDNAREI